MYSSIADDVRDRAVDEIQLFQGDMLQLMATPRRRAVREAEPAPEAASVPAEGGKSFSRPVQLRTRTVGRRCGCGKCEPCVDNARWDAIFNAKFADANYYERRGPRMASTLSSLH